VALQAALGDVVARHESLRTVFPDVEACPTSGCQILTRPPRVDGHASMQDELAGEVEAAARYAFNLATEHQCGRSCSSWPLTIIETMRVGADDNFFTLVSDPPVGRPVAG
jgi:hypothetical protein